MAVADSPAVARTGYGTLRQLDGYQWFVFLVAAVAWMADCMDQQLFNLARQTSLADLLHLPTTDDAVKTWGSRATSVFLIGWATGGLLFGSFGDRIGRVRTLTYTILLYSVFTGLSALSQGVYDYCLYRFLTGLGVGGVFAAAVALLAETMPPDARPYTLGLMQAFSAIGNCTAAGLFILLGLLGLNGHLGGVAAWRILFLIGLVPAVLVVFIQRRLHEPESWLAAKKAADAGTGKKLGSYRDLLLSGGWVTRHALLGVLLSFVGVVGLWGLTFFVVDLQQTIFVPSYTAGAEARGLTGEEAKQYIAGQRVIWAGITSLSLNVGAFVGMSGFGLLAGRLGRRPAFAITFVAAAASVALVFTQMRTRFHVVWMNVAMGTCVMALFGGYAIYLPELFPTRLRATGTSFCYNVGRFVAASGPLMLGYLTTSVFAYAKADGADLPFRYAGLAMCSIFALGLAVLPFLPETRGKPLPE